MEFVACGGDPTGSWELSSACRYTNYGDSDRSSAGTLSGTFVFAPDSLSVDIRGGVLHSVYAWERAAYEDEACDSSCSESDGWCRNCGSIYGADVVSRTLSFDATGPATLEFEGGFSPSSKWETIYTLDFCVAGSAMSLRSSDGETMFVLRRR